MGFNPGFYVDQFADHWLSLKYIKKLDRNVLDQVQQKPFVSAKSKEPVFQNLLDVDAIERTSSDKGKGRWEKPVDRFGNMVAKPTSTSSSNLYQ